MATATRRSARLSAKATPSLPSTSEPAAPSKAASKATASSRNRKRTAQVLEEETDNGEGGAGAGAPLVTRPKKKASRAAKEAPPPPSPTPAAVTLIVEHASSPPVTPKPKSRAVNRLVAADPNATHATLISPETSRVIRPSAAAPAAAPSTGSASATETTTSDSILEQACSHLISVDARMKPLIDGHHCRVFSGEGLAEKIDPFESLVSGIISQQVSGAAAKSIKARFIGLFSESAEATDDSTIPAKFPNPSTVAACSMERLRSAGLSQRKAEYVQGLAAKFASGELSASMLMEASYDEVIEKLTAVRGLGRWSVEMFACFGLKRLDVFSLGDLGVQRGMAAFVGRDINKLKSKGGKWKYMSEKEMEEISAKFAPYRSVFMWYMWRVEDTDISTLE